jgi:hypothetical protein
VREREGAMGGGGGGGGACVCIACGGLDDLLASEERKEMRDCEEKGRMSRKLYQKKIKN